MEPLHSSAVSLGGYILSEIPFCLALLAGTYFALRLMDESRASDAFRAGLAAAIGVTIRPQLAIGMRFSPSTISSTLANRAAFGSLLSRAAIPLVLVLAFSASRFYYHTRRVGLISDSGSLNMLFGRCHPLVVTAADANSFGSFRLAEFDALDAAEKRGAYTVVSLAPAVGTEITYRGYIGDSRAHAEFIRRCIAAGGWRRQLYYSFSHLVPAMVYTGSARLRNPYDPLLIVIAVVVYRGLVRRMGAAGAKLFAP